MRCVVTAAAGMGRVLVGSVVVDSSAPLRSVLNTCSKHAEYFGGSVDLVNMPGYGVDTYVRLNKDNDVHI